MLPGDRHGSSSDWRRFEVKPAACRGRLGAGMRGAECPGHPSAFLYAVVMDWTLFWTAMGSAGAVAGVAVAGVVAAAQARDARRHPPLEAGDRIRVVLEPPAGTARGAGDAVLRAPTGRLPENVRGREDLLTRLLALTAKPDGRVHVLVGLGGTGKSTVALRVAEQHARVDRPVWWIPAADGETMTSKLLGLAAELGAPHNEVVEARGGRRDAADLLWRLLDSRQGWLLVFDNADDLRLLTVDGNEVSSGAGWIRPSTTGLVLVTSRERRQPEWGRHAELHPVGDLSPEDGAQVLLDLAPDSGPVKDAQALSVRLGGLPLALHHAGSQLGSEFAAEQTFKAYTQALGERFGQLMGRGVTGDRAIVTKTWEISLDVLAAHGRPRARPLLRILSCLAPGVLIPGALLVPRVLSEALGDAGAALEESADALAALLSVGLITASPIPDRPGVTVHPLVAETNRLHLDDADLAGIPAAVARLITAATAGLEPQVAEHWRPWLQLFPHVHAAYGYIAARLGDADLAGLAGVSAHAAHALLWAGSYAAALDLAQYTLQHSARLGHDHKDILSVRDAAASAHRFRGEYAQADEQYRSILDDELRLYGPDHPYTLDTRFELARVLVIRGELTEASREYQDVLRVRLRDLGPDHSSTLSVRRAIAGVLARQGLLNEAEQELRGVLAVQQRTLGADHHITLNTRLDIAFAMERQGRLPAAEEEYRAVLADQLPALGPDHPSVLDARLSIAAVQAMRGMRRQAIREYRAVLTDQSRVLGPDHPSTQRTRRALASLEKASLWRAGELVSK